jgi:two-component system chemotaxis response regulator CheY
MPAPTGILVVDYLATSSEAILGLLGQLGFADVEHEAEAQGALRRLRERAFALVISEWRLGAMSGLELLRRIRKDCKLHRVRFLLISASPHPQLANTAQTLGADGLLRKPFTAAALRVAIETATSSGYPG